VELCNAALSKLVRVCGAQQAALAHQHVPMLDRITYVVQTMASAGMSVREEVASRAMTSTGHEASYSDCNAPISQTAGTRKGARHARVLTTVLGLDSQLDAVNRDTVVFPTCCAEHVSGITSRPVEPVAVDLKIALVSAMAQVLSVEAGSSQSSTNCS
jgi:hypothetical protein